MEAPPFQRFNSNGRKIAVSQAITMNVFMAVFY
jgi:hypothetical protein